jgi:hypothetical protein
MGTTNSTLASLSDQKAKLRVQSASLELLRLIVGFTTCPDRIINTVKTSLVPQLHHSIRQSNTLLQPQMLALLEITMTRSTTTRMKHQKKRSMLEKPEVVPESEFDLSLIQVIIEAISTPQNRPVLRHWIDFVLAITPSIGTRPTLVLMLCECMSDQLRRDVLQLRATRRDLGTQDVKSVLTEAEPLFLLAGLERLVLLVFSSGRDRAHNEDSLKPQGEGGLMGLVSGVFTVEAPINDKVRKVPFMREINLPHRLRIAYSIWTTLSMLFFSHGPLPARSDLASPLPRRQARQTRRSASRLVRYWIRCSRLIHLLSLAVSYRSGPLILRILP